MLSVYHCWIFSDWIKWENKKQLTQIMQLTMWQCPFSSMIFAAKHIEKQNSIVRFPLGSHTWLPNGTQIYHADSWDILRGRDMPRPRKTYLKLTLQWINRDPASHRGWKTSFHYPIGSMYGIYANIWAIYGVNGGKYSIHGAYGYV